MIYLDHAATTPLLPAAREAWLAAQTQCWGNPSSVHRLGQQARHAVDQAKARLAARLGCTAAELVLTSGGSEANALAVHAALHRDDVPAESSGGFRIIGNQVGSSSGRHRTLPAGGAAALPAAAAQAPAAPGSGSYPVVNAGRTVLASAIEHSSVLRAAMVPGVSLRLIAVDSCGRLAPDQVGMPVPGWEDSTRLVCVQYANNEIGTVQDVAGIVAGVRARAPRAWVLLDCAQGAGKRALDLRALGVDLASIAGHKFGAPKGTGLLYVRQGLKIAPLIRGGRQQADRRSGTEDAAAAMALAAALETACDHAAAEEQRLADLMAATFARLHAALPAVVWHARHADRLAGIMSLGFSGIDGAALVQRLDLAGICVSTGAACMAARGEASHVLRALCLDPDLARGTIRVSAGHSTTADDLLAFVVAYVREASQLRRT